MKGFLGLASDFIEKMANPAYGTQVNESYGLRLAQLLDQDREAVGELAHMSELDAGDLSLLTTDGWLWLLGWMKSHGTRPSDDLLHSLFDNSNSLVLRLHVVEAVTTTADLKRTKEGWRESPPNVREFPESWLRTRMEKSVIISGPETRIERGEAALQLDPENVQAAVAESFELAMLLLQVGNESAMLALRSLLAHPWNGAELLRAHIAQLFSGLDEETRRNWYLALGLEDSDGA